MYLQLETLQHPKIAHGFSTRQGGVSTGPYASLNLKLPHYEQDDDLSAVMENRRRLCVGLGVDPTRLVACQQVHGKQIHKVTAPDAGRGHASHLDGIPECDGLITDLVGVPLLVMVADCIPVILTDPQQGVVAAVHAGWRGTQQGIVAEAIELMVQDYGANPSDIHVGIGAGIGFDAFEVGPEVAEAFQDQIDLSDASLAYQKGEKYHLNLQAINRLQAQAKGVPDTQIAHLPHCTFRESELFYSYRRDKGVTGRLGALVCLT